MRTIPLTQGQVVVVDNSDYGWLSKFRWYAVWSPDIRSFYAVRTGRSPNGCKLQIRMHREILGLTFGDKRQGDHINHRTLDNRRVNLRIVTNQENQFNTNAKGYYPHRQSGKFKALIEVNGATKYLGLFPTAALARRAYQKAKRELHRISAQ